MCYIVIYLVSFHMTTPSFICESCNFSAPTRARFSKHLSTQKHSRLTSRSVEPSVSENANTIVLSSGSESYENDFRCYECRSLAPHNTCLRCNRADICETCEGDGGEYGLCEEWVCYGCLPVCLKCSKNVSNGGPRT